MPQFRVCFYPFEEIINQPAIFSHDGEIDLHTACPKLFKGRKRLAIPFAGLNGSYHENGRVFLYFFQGSEPFFGDTEGR